MHAEVAVLYQYVLSCSLRVALHLCADESVRTVGGGRPWCHNASRNEVMYVVVPDRTTIMTLRKVAKDGAIAALAASRPGRPRADRAEVSELGRLRADNERLTATIVEQAIELAALRGKASWA